VGSSQSSSALEQSEYGVVERDGLAVSFRVVRSARRHRTIELTLEADGVRVAAPLRTPTHEIAEFVRSRVPWIRKHRTSQRPTLTPLAYVSGESLPYLGRWLPIEAFTAAGRHVRVDIDLLGLRIAVPARHAGETRRAEVEAAVREWYRRRASEEIRARVAYWAGVAGYGPRRVIIRDQKRRWGSCSPDGTLRFNWRLIMMEPRLVDYVVVHELAHLVRAHHRPSFWAEVERMLPEYRGRRAGLREAGAALPL
jgi:predicted metal-dependent hydrolase